MKNLEQYLATAKNYLFSESPEYFSRERELILAFVKTHNLEESFIKQVKEIQPEATIYLQSIIYVTKKESESDSIFTNERIRLYNDKIKELAQKEQVKYIDLNETLAPEGELKETATIDGIHLVKEYYEKWLQVLNQVN